MDFSSMENNILLQVVEDILQILKRAEPSGSSVSFWNDLYNSADREVTKRQANGSL